jgi:hypothetical protein
VKILRKKRKWNIKDLKKKGTMWGGMMPSTWPLKKSGEVNN